ncbi:MAG: hypothetical protein JW951_02500 [Lentisphaerae bacterium]|nr:hypothetical protein [Lentisphaerota bacterium]
MRTVLVHVLVHAYLWSSASGAASAGQALVSPSGQYRLVLPRAGYPRLVEAMPDGSTNTFEIIPWSATWDTGKPEFAPDYAGPTVDAQEGSGFSIQGSGTTQNRNPSSALAVYRHPDLSVTLRFEALDDGLRITPVRLAHTRTNRLCRFSYPAALYLPVAEGMHYLDPVWGRLARNAEAIRAGWTFAGACPLAAHDLGVMLTPGGAWGSYTVQPADGRTFRRTHFGLVTDRLKTLDRTGLRHGVSCWLAPGEETALPAIRLVRAGSPFEIFAAYRRDNGMDAWPDLADKLTPRLAEKLPDAVHLKAWFRGIARYEQEGRMDELFALLPPPPLLIEFVASTRNGRHDTYYPDFLDFDRDAGGAPMMKRLITRFKERGDLVTMYTHATWWHDNTEAVAALGGADAVAVRGRAGALRVESWPNSDGYAVGVWREPVRHFVHDQLTTLRDAFGFDMIFQDQVGTRLNYDFSPDFRRPPYAWVQSLFDIVAMSASVLPLSGEGVGPDRAFRDMTATFGFYLVTMNDGARKRFYDRQHQAGNTRQWPMATMVLHDKVAFYPHNLERTDNTGPGMSRAHLSWCLAAGMNLHYTMEEVLADREAGLGSRRFAALAHVQRAVCAKYFGRPVTGFEFLGTDPEITRTTFANGLVILASHADESLMLREGSVTVAVPPHGWLALDRDRPLSALLASDRAADGMLADWSIETGTWQPVMPYRERPDPGKAP